jgi:hypothetical protein
MGTFHRVILLGSILSASTIFNQAEGIEEIIIFPLSSTQRLALLTCPLRHFPAMAKDKEKRDNIKSPTRSRRDANTIIYSLPTNEWKLSVAAELKES